MAAGGNSHSLITPLELIRQKSELVTPFELLRETKSRSPTRPHKKDEARSLLGLSALPPAPQPKSSPSGSSSASPPSSPHDCPPSASTLMRRRSDPKGSSPLALSAIRCEDAPSPPMSPTSPTKANDSNGARPSSPKHPEMVHLRRIAVERSRKSTKIISFLDTVTAVPKPPPRSSPPIVSPPDFLGISRRRTRSFAMTLSPDQWSAADTLSLAMLVERFDHWVSKHQEAPTPLARHRTRTMAFSSSPLTLMKHKRCLSLPNDFSLRVAEPFLLSESTPALGSVLDSSSSSSLGGGAVHSTSPPLSPVERKRSKKEKKVKKEKKSHKRSHEKLPAMDEPSPRAAESPQERRPSSDPVIEAADLHSYIATLLAPKCGLLQQSFKESLDWVLTAYRNYATPVELAASLHVLWTFCASGDSPEMQAHEQKWITLNYESEFLLESGLPDPVTQKALGELISRAPDAVQYQFRQMIEEQQREVKQYNVLTIQPRKKGKIPIGLKKADINLVALIDPSELARCFTLLDWDLMIKVRRVDMLAKAYPHVGKGMQLTALAQVTAKWNALQTWVTAEIVTSVKLKQRAALLERFIMLAATLLDEQQNYHTFFAVMLGMKDASVQRMKGTWKRLSSSMLGLYAKLDRLTDLTGGYKVYRASVKELRRQKISAIVPFIVVPISDLVMLGHVPDHVEGTGAVNWAKTANVGRVLADFEDMRRACRKSLSEALWTEADVAIMRMLPPLRVERFELLSDDFLFCQSKLHEPSVIL